MAIVSKGKAARGVIGFGIAVVGVFALGLVWFVISFLMAWASAHFFSFAAVMGTILLVAFCFGLFNAIEWAMGVLDNEKEEEKRAQERKRIENKLKEYREKWGEKATPPQNYNGVYYFDEEPEEAIG